MTDIVHVRLKHPHGIIFDISNGRRVVLKGSDFALRGQEKGILLCGFSKNQVPSADWEEVTKTYSGMISEWKRKGTLIYEKDVASADDHAEDNKDVKHGREPVDVKNDKTIKTEEVPAGEAA